MLKIGLIVNPIAGIGGKVGLKGSDGKEILLKALTLGAKHESNNKAKVALEQLKKIKDEIIIYTFPSEMGCDIVLECGLEAVVFGEITSGHTKPSDTENAARTLADAGADIILFAGGDGTARNVMNSIGTSLPVLGIPTGCKIHSAAYALNPKRAGDLIAKFCEGKVKSCREAEVMDIDENLFRQNIVQSKLHGYLKVPNEGSMMQNMKSGRGKSEKTTLHLMASYIVDSMERNTLYIIGPGSTTRAILERLGLKNT